MQTQAPKTLAAPKAQKNFRLVVTVAGLALLLVGSLWAPLSTLTFLPYALIFGLFIAFQVIFPFQLLGDEISLIHVLTLGSGLLFGPVLPAWAAVFGMPLGYLLRLQRSRPSPRWIGEREILFTIGAQVSAIISVFLVFNWPYGIVFSSETLSLEWPRALGVMLLFAVLHGGLFLLDAWTGQKLAGAAFRRDATNLGMLELLPAPFIVAAVLSYNQAGLGPLVVLGVIPLILAILLAINAELHAAVSHGRDRMEAVLNSVDEGILILDTSGKILLANESIYAITRVPHDELVGKNLAELPAARLAALGYSAEEVQELLPVVKLGYLPPALKTIVKAPAAAEKHILERLASPVWGKNERLIGWMILLRDVSEEYRVAESRELITETMVHDLRSPLGVILGALDIISGSGPASPPTDPETVSEAISIARRSSQRVLSLVESLLDIARLQTGKMETTLSPTSLNALAENVISELLPQAQEYGISLRSDIAADFPRVRADAGKITRVITNLVDNALKFTPQDGQVVLAATIAPNHMAAVMVSDTGPGVPPEFRQKIFERFTQIPGVHGRRRGSGLGLTFCRLAVEAHGGRIGVEPRPGGGSIFSFTLPLAEIIPLSEPASSRAATEQTARSVRKV